jgi:CBS domain-containing protein
MTTISAILRHKGTDVAAVAPTARVPEIAQELARRNIGAVLVRDAAGQLLGIVSERDIVRRLASEGAAVLERTAAQLMTSALQTATPATTGAQALKLMTDSRVRHHTLLEDGRLCGIVSIGDVVKARIMQQDQEVDSLKAYVAGVA